MWRTDGTTGGTFRVADVNPGATGSDPTGLTVSGGVLFFAANDGTGYRLFRYDPAAGVGPVRVKGTGGTDNVFVNQSGLYDTQAPDARKCLLSTV